MPKAKINKHNKDVNKKITCAVIGVGRVGLPLCLVLAESGYNVIGIDRDMGKHDLYKSGRMPFIEEGGDKLLRKHYAKNFILEKISSLKKCSVVFICIGTFLSPELSPDTGALYELIDEIIPFLQKDVLLILRSTVEPNATEKIYAYLHKKTHTPFSLVYAPERIAEGFAVKELYSLPQVIGYFDEPAFNRAAEIFLRFAPEVIKTDTLTAELSKLVLNTHRYASFALANELMMIVEHFGRNINEVLKVANKNYPRGNIPGPGLAAGPCLVKDSFFLRYGTPYNTMITGSHIMNEKVIDFMVERMNSGIGLKDKKIAVLGLAFKKNIDDDRGSLSLKLIQQLKTYTKSVAVHDPYLLQENIKEVLSGADGVFITVNHDEYGKFDRAGLRKITGKNSRVCDIWNVLRENKLFYTL